MFNDVAVAARILQAEDPRLRIVVVDLDVHQGDGTAAIFAGDPGAYTISFLERYEEAPVIVITPGQEKRIATANTTAVGADVTIADLNGTPVDADFSFIVEPV